MKTPFREIHPPSEYALVWQNVAGGARLTHRVIACSQPDALRRSKAVMEKVLASNRSNWDIVRIHSRWHEWEEMYETVSS